MSHSRTQAKGRAIFLGLLAAAIVLFSASPALAESRWNDISDQQWSTYYGLSADAVAQVADGFPDGSFHPWQLVTREQFAKMVASGLGIEATSPATATFVDVPPSHQYYSWIEAVAGARLIQGSADGNFKGSLPISREQTFSVLGRFLSAKELSSIGFIQGVAERYTNHSAWFESEGRERLEGYQDEARVSSVHAPCAAYLVAHEVAEGGSSQQESLLDPQGNLTRAQAVALVLRTKNVTFSGGEGLSTKEVVKARWGDGVNEIGLSPTKEEGPSSFVVSGDGSIWVLDAWKRRILSYSPDGTPTGMVPVSTAYGFDVARTPDGSFLVTDVAGDGLQLYTPAGELMSTIGFNNAFWPGSFYTAGGTVYLAGGWQEDGINRAVYVAVWSDGQLRDVDLAHPTREALQPLDQIPLEQGSLEHLDLGEGRWGVRVTQAGSVIVDQELTPSPGGSLHANLLADGRLVIAGFIVDDEPEGRPNVGHHHVWVIDSDGHQSSYDLGVARTTWGYVHSPARITPEGEIYFMNTDEDGLTIWKTVL